MKWILLKNRYWSRAHSFRRIQCTCITAHYNIRVGKHDRYNSRKVTIQLLNGEKSKMHSEKLSPVIQVEQIMFNHQIAGVFLFTPHGFLVCSFLVTIKTL